MIKKITTYKEKNFDLPEIDGISEKQIKVHLGLYAGYVAHVNKINNFIASTEDEDQMYPASETFRRFGFEYNGMRNHEHYFGALVGGSKEIKDCKLKQSIEASYGSIDDCENIIKKIAKNMRGSGWIMMHYDKQSDNIIFNWVTNHEVGQTTALQPILAIDMWEHAYMVDYLPSDKLKYVDAYLKAVNWEIVSEKFDSYQN